MDPDDRIDVLQEAIDYLARAGELLRPLGDPFLGAYVTRQPEDHSRRSTWPNELTAHSSCSSVIPTVSTRSRRTRPPPGGALSGTSQETPHGAGSRWAAGLSHAAVTRHQTRPKAPTPRRETQLNHPNARSCRLSGCLRQLDDPAASGRRLLALQRRARDLAPACAWIVRSCLQS